MRLLLVPILLIAACSSAPEFCEGDTRFAYDPVQGDAAAAFPDDFYTVDDATSLTGLRPHVSEENAPWLKVLSPLGKNLYLEVDALDGFGTSAGVVLRFTGEVGAFPSGDASRTSDAVLFVELGEGPPKRIPFETRPTDDGATMILWPMQPLKPKTPHAVVVTRRQADAKGACISPSPVLRALLTGEDVPDALASLTPRYRTLLSKLGLAADEVSAATVFTTGSIEEASVKVAADVAARSFQWSKPPACEAPKDGYLACTGAFVAGRYTRDDVYVDGTVQSTYELPVSVWLPASGDGPFPVVMFGHGLSGSRHTGRWLARIAAPLGLAVVAIDAFGHGDHPTSDPDEAAPPRVLRFFGIDMNNIALSPFAMRDHFRASTWDKLQLVELLKQQPTLADGALDPERMAYLGVSLGGIMASELLSLTDAFDAAVLIVAGARMGSIVSDSPAFSLFLEAFRSPYMSQGDVDAMVPVLQALIEPGDPINYAPHVLRDRFPNAGSRTPHVLFNAVIDDDTVVNAANHALARALGTPHLAPVVKPVGLVEVLESGPVSGNLDERTAAFFQFDRYTKGSGAIAATHDNVWDGPETKLQVTRFLETWRDGGAPEIVDPYAELNTPPLP